MHLSNLMSACYALVRDSYNCQGKNPLGEYTEKPAIYVCS